MEHSNVPGTTCRAVIVKQIRVVAVCKCGATSAVVVLHFLALLPHPTFQLAGGVLDAAAV